MDELDQAIKEARSFSELTPPAGSTLVGVIDKNGERYYYYQRGNEYFYESAGQKNFKQEMRKKELERKYAIRR